jgi:chitodextrinase
VDLSWQASTDDVGVVAYRVIRDGTHVGSTSQTSFSDSTVASGQTYRYVVRAEDAAGLLSDPSEAVSVTTPPPGSSSFVFAAGGDHGANAKTAASLATLDGSGADFYLALGDLDYDETASDEAWCDYVTTRLPTLGATFPFQLVAGNHEEYGGSDGYILNHAACLPDRLGATPAPGGFYGTDYYVDYPTSAPLARVIMISPDIWIEGVEQRYTAGSSWYAWLASTIDEARTTGIPWVIVGMHKNCITAGTKGCEIGSDLLQLLVDRRVDLVLQGHDHNYQRSKQLALDAATCPSVSVGSADVDCVADDGSDDVYPRGGGTVIVISGVFGAGSHGVSLADSEGPYFAALDSSTWGLTRFVVTEDRIDGNFMPTTGSFGDAFSIVRGATAGADRSPPSRPTALTATPTASTRVDLAWAPSVDDASVAGYLVLRDGQHVGTTGATTFTDTGLVAGTTYSYTVRAFDAANNVSDPSDPASAMPAPPGQVVSFTVSADATIREAAPTLNFGTTSPVQVDGSPIKHMLLRFEVSGIGTSPVAAARILLYAVDPSILGGDAFAAAGTAWTESSVTWSNAPAQQPPQLDSLGPVVAGAWYELDVTPAITGDGVYTFRLSSTSANGADYSSREGQAGFAPTLEIELA